MIDIHSHFLPGIDDGARNASESVEMLSDCFKKGVKLCAATPHLSIHSQDDIERFLENRLTAVRRLNEELARTKAEVPRLLYGAEIYLDNDISAFDGLDRLCISGTRLMLVELSEFRRNSGYAEWLYSLNAKGILPILAHVERYEYFDWLYDELSGVDVVYQVNADTLLSMKGRRFLLDLHNSGRPVLVSGDMHNMTSRRNRMGEARKKLGLLHKNAAERLFGGLAGELLGVD